MQLMLMVEGTCNRRRPLAHRFAHMFLWLTEMKTYFLSSSNPRRTGINDKYGGVTVLQKLVLTSRFAPEKVTLTPK